MEERYTLLALAFVEVLYEFENVNLAEFRAWFQVGRDFAELPTVLRSTRDYVVCEASGPFTAVENMLKSCRATQQT